jgi:hypothetical protein
MEIAMMQVEVDVGSIPTAAALERDARRLGYVPGFPPRLTPANRLTDARACRRLKCPACHARGMTCKPFHKPDGYKIVAACSVCGAGEEV